MERCIFGATERFGCTMIAGFMNVRKVRRHIAAVEIWKIGLHAAAWGLYLLGNAQCAKSFTLTARGRVNTLASNSAPLYFLPFGLATIGRVCPSRISQEALPCVFATPHFSRS